MKRTYSLFSQDKDMPICFFETFDKEEIKKAIIEHLNACKQDVLELCREFNKKDLRKYYGVEILSFYANNKSGTPSLVITKGTKEYYKPLTKQQ